MHKDTLVVIPYDDRRPQAFEWLRESIASLNGEWSFVVASNTEHGPAHGVNQCEILNGPFPKYVFNLDADDRIANWTAMHRMRHMMVQNNTPCVFAGFKAFNDAGIQPYPHKKYPTAEYLQHSFNQRGLRGFDWEKVQSIGGIDTTLKRFEWFDLTRRLTQRYGDPSYLDEVATFYRLHPNQLTEHGAQPPEFQWVINRPKL